MSKKVTPLEKTSASLFDAWKPEENASVVALDENVVGRLSVLAIVAAIAGAASLFSPLHLSFLGFSILAIVAAIFSLLAIAKSGGELAGKKFAAVGLALGLAGAVAGPTRQAVYRADFERQADQFCKIWFETIQDGDYLALRQMERPYWERVAILKEDDEILYWKKFADDEEAHFRMHDFLTNSALLTLATLGDRVEPSFYACESLELSPKNESTTRVYAATHTPENGGKKQTFFLRLTVDRVTQVSERGERKVGWSARCLDWEPLHLDEHGRPELDSDEEKN